MSIMYRNNDLSVALTIAGSDSGGNAGIQADLLTMSALDVHGTSAVTCLTAQNPDSVSRVIPVEPDAVVEQIQQVTRFFDIKALKTGMLLNVGIIEALIDCFDKLSGIPKVVDPVMVASSGAVLLEAEAIDALRGKLLPRATLITPNLDEAAVLLHEKPESVETLKSCALKIALEYGVACLLKGGHLPGEAIVDCLAFPDKRTIEYPSHRIQGVNTHGSGCTLSAAIASFLAKGLVLEQAVDKAHRYLRKTLVASKKLNGQSFIQHSIL